MSVNRFSGYRYPGEQWILFITCCAFFLLVLLTAALTFRASLILIGASVVITYFSNRIHHARLMRQANLVNERSATALTGLARQCAARLGCPRFQLFIARRPELNAYTFGLNDPKIVVLYSALFQEMDADEIRFVLGHELGHICLGHTWLNSVVGGMAGIPSSIGLSSLFRGIFLWWNRACEKSADRAGLLACGRLDKALSALLKLAAGPGSIRSQADVQRILQLVEAEGAGSLSALQELLETHPTVIHRMAALRDYADSLQYHSAMNQLEQHI